eukprot:Hpha_TRINITY_DN3292_c0_g1::TRINITY_DN3292_c0_g1_i1::g.185814::m.185814
MSEDKEFEQFLEVLPFLGAERDDVRAQAVQVLLQFLSQEKYVNFVLREKRDLLGRLTGMLIPGPSLKLYGSTLLKLLINLCVSSVASQLMVEGRGIQRTLVLYTKGGLDEPGKELCLRFLSNLTSVSEPAAETVLQKGGGIQEGYYFGIFLREYVDGTLPREELALQTEAPERKPTLWLVGNILRNCMQAADGRRLLMEDPEAVSSIARTLSDEDDQIRTSSAGILRNMLIHASTHPLLCDVDTTAAAAIVMKRLEGVALQAKECERLPDVISNLVEGATALTGSEPGRQLIDGTGGKATFKALLTIAPPKCRSHLQRAVDQCDDVQDVVVQGPGAVELLEPGKVRAKKLPPGTGTAVDAIRGELASMTVPGVVTDYDATLKAAQRLTAARYLLYKEHDAIYPAEYPPPAPGDGADVFKACDEAGEGLVTRKEIAKFLMRNQNLRHRLREGWGVFQSNFGTEDIPENHATLSVNDFMELWQRAAALRPDFAEAPVHFDAALPAGSGEAEMSALD